MNESPNKSVVIVGLFVFIGIAFLVVGVLMMGASGVLVVRTATLGHAHREAT